MKIIDTHIHMYPPEVFADAVSWGNTHEEPLWANTVAPKGKRSLQGWSTVDELLHDMDAVQVDRCIMLGWYWEQQATCELQNQWYIDWIRAHPDRLSGFASIQPNSGQRGIDNLQYAIENGLIGIGEMLPQTQHFSFTDESWQRIVECADKYNLPINLHVTDPSMVSLVGGTVETPLDSFVELIRKFPNNCFILAHWGGGLPFYELNKKIRPLFKNVFYDTAASPLLYDPEIYSKVIDIIGHERILFGTDYPLLCHPKITRNPSFTHSINDVKQLNLPHGQFGHIMGENARKLFGF